MHRETLIAWLTQEGPLIAWVTAGVLFGILGIPRAPWQRWVIAAVLIVSLVVVAVFGAYLMRDISFGTAPLLSLLIAGMAGALCVLPARLLPDRMWWPFFGDPDYDNAERGRRGQLLAVLCGVMFADLVIWAWVRDPSAHRPALRANVAASLQFLVLIPIAGLQSSYLRALIQREDRGRERDFMKKQELAYGKVVWSRLIGLGVPVGVLVLSMVGEVIGRNGLDNLARPEVWVVWPLPVAFAGAWAMLLVVRACVRGPLLAADTLDLPWLLAVLIIVVIMGVCLIVYIIDHVFFETGWAVVLAAIYGVTTAHSLYFHTAGEHLVRPRTSVAAIIVAVGTSSTLLLLWLLSCALWSSGRPLYTSRTVSIAAFTLVGNGLLVWTIGTILVARRARNLSGYTTEQNLGIDLLSYAGFGVVLTILPDVLVGHLKYVPHNELLWVLLVPAVLLGLQAVRFAKELFGAVDHMLAKDHIKILLIEGEPLVDRQTSQRHDRRVRNHFSVLKVATFLALAVSVIWILSAAV